MSVILYKTVFSTGIYKERNANHYLLILTILPDLACTANKILRSFVRIFHDFRKYFMRPPNRVSEIIFPVNNGITTGCAFFRSVQGKIHEVSILLNKRACFDLITMIIPPCLISLPFSGKEKFTVPPTIPFLTITIF